MNIALIFAGGIGNRMDSKNCPKQFLELYDKPIIIYTLEHFEKHPEIDAIVIACVEDWIPHLEHLLDEFNITKVKEIIKGGSTGQESIFKGLLSIEKHFPKESIVLIHDAVRPIITNTLIAKNINSVKEFGTAVSTAPLTETPTQLNSKGEIIKIHEREFTRLAKAPQSFKLSSILKIHRKAIEDEYSTAMDSCSLMMHYGETIKLIEGEGLNIKITVPADYFIFKALIDAKYKETFSPPKATKLMKKPHESEVEC